MEDLREKLIWEKWMEWLEEPDTKTCVHEDIHDSNQNRGPNEEAANVTERISSLSIQCAVHTTVFHFLMNEPKAASIFEYIRNVDILLLDELFSHPPTCLVIFRELPELAKHFVARLLFVEQPIPKSIVSGWVEKGSQALLQDACRALSDLRIWHSVDGNVARGAWCLSKKYQESLRISLFGGGKSLLGDLGSTTVDKYSKDVGFLETYAAERWDSLLHFMVGSESSEVGSVVQDVLLLSNLMKGGTPDTPVGITKHGFHFLLMSRPDQVRLFLLHYFDYLKETKKNLVAALQFVFQLSFLSPEKSYPVDALTAPQQEVLQQMRELGLAYQRKRTAPRFYVTPLATVLSGSRCHRPAMSSGSVLNAIPTGVSHLDGTDSVQPTASSTSDVGYILLETNFRLYAYTDSPLRTALLSLFSKIRARFPNLVVADITRDSVREALIRGITADQPPILPPTLVDQIRLWELERDRFVFQEGCLYEQFSKSADFEMVRDFAKSIGVLLWENPERRLMVVSKAGHEDVRKFWKQKRPS
ncbi:Transcription factor tfb2 [Opisthorchis viverrini]|uniref:General transcription factor IIH subunit 4 n=1 Tax=Opisthorchis viverrini TaxID=6198 RepID=A0A1S8X2C1_OPIVI|nr:Transcription factor tfb2 [Opisthorchis viverrini]